MSKRIGKTTSPHIDDHLDHHHQRRLFKELNILTKSQKKQQPFRQNSMLLRKRQERAARLRALQMPRQYRSQDISQIDPKSFSHSVSASISLKRKISNMPMTEPRKQIYKSTFYEVHLSDDPETPRQKEQPKTVETEESADHTEVPQFPIVKFIGVPTPESQRRESKSSSRRGSALKNYSTMLLDTIFEGKNYDSTFEEVNKNLLKRQRHYEPREWKIQTKHNWRI